ncbi:MAG: hypothetical protein Q7T80_17165, partial [Methanoregula sp.]|nr:hypothetical protein [Methanoregula sp.]
MKKLLWLVTFALAIFVVVGCIGFPGPGSTEKVPAPVHLVSNKTFTSGSPAPTYPVPVITPTINMSMITPAPANDEGLTARIAIDRD